MGWFGFHLLEKRFLPSDNIQVVLLKLNIFLIPKPKTRSI